MKIKSALVTQISGSVGGMTGSHNQGGMYFRARSIPTNPQTSYQVVVRNAMRTLSTRWSSTLTADQREAWAVYATNVPLIDRLGDARIIPPLAMYVRSNVPRIQASLSIVDDGPTVFSLPSNEALGYTTTAGTPGSVSITFQPGDDPFNETGGGALIYASRPQAPTIKFFKGPYRYVGMIEGDDDTPPTSPATFDLPFAVAGGNNVFYSARTVRADGRLSSTFPSAAAAPSA